VCISATYSSLTGASPLFEAYKNASPPVYDVLQVDRYPIYRKYDVAGHEGDTAFEIDKLGLSADKARLENLADNEFANLADYYDSLSAAARARIQPGQRVRASMQAYGLRDDCAGPACLAVNENNARRSPTWAELLNMLSSSWFAGLDGIVLYSH